MKLKVIKSTRHFQRLAPIVPRQYLLRQSVLQAKFCIRKLHTVYVQHYVGPQTFHLHFTAHDHLETRLLNSLQ